MNPDGRMRRLRNQMSMQDELFTSLPALFPVDYADDPSPNTVLQYTRQLFDEYEQLPPYPGTPPMAPMDGDGVNVPPMFFGMMMTRGEGVQRPTVVMRATVW